MAREYYCTCITGTVECTKCDDENNEFGIKIGGWYDVFDGRFQYIKGIPEYEVFNNIKDINTFFQKYGIKFKQILNSRF